MNTKETAPSHFLPASIFMTDMFWVSSGNATGAKSLLNSSSVQTPATHQNWKIRIILDNHSYHVSKETLSWLKTKPNRFEFVYTVKDGSWLNIIEVFFSKMTRAFLRFLRVSSKEELRQRIEQYLYEVNAAAVIFGWKYEMDEVRV